MNYYFDCVKCGKRIFRGGSAQLSRQKTKMCRDCYISYGKKDRFITASCQMCGRKFTYHNSNKRKNCSVECYNLFRSQNRPYNFKERIIDKDGYILLWCPDHPNRDYKNRYREHRLVMEQYLGRYLDKEEVVHHINKNKSDNRLENLILFSDDREHRKSEIGDFKRDSKGRFTS